MIDNPLDLIKKFQWLDWGTLYIGAMGIHGVSITPTDISDYACSSLNEIDSESSVFISVAELAYSNEISHETLKHLRIITDWYNINLQLSKSKWRLAAFMILMESLNSDYVYALLDLNNFWYEWDGNDTPNVIQGVENDMNPSEFYSAENFKNIIENNKAWINKEINAINICVNETSHGPKKI